MKCFTPIQLNDHVMMFLGFLLRTDNYSTDRKHFMFPFFAQLFWILINFRVHSTGQVEQGADIYFCAC